MRYAFTNYGYLGHMFENAAYPIVPEAEQIVILNAASKDDIASARKQFESSVSKRDETI